MAPTTSSGPWTGKTLSHNITLHEVLSTDSYGAIYRATGGPQSPSHPNTTRFVQVFHDSVGTKPVQWGNFEADLEEAQTLHYPDLSFCLAHSLEDTPRWIAWDSLSNETVTLRDLLQHGPFSTEAAFLLVSRIAAALEHLHERRIYHRNLTPDSILLSKHTHAALNSKPHLFTSIPIHIQHWARAHLVAVRDPIAQCQKTPDAFFGNPHYFSPEQAQGKPLSASSDLYALGIVLYELLVGKPPFTSEDQGTTLKRHIYETPLAPNIARPELKLDDDAQYILLTALAKKDSDRFQSCAALRAALGAVGHDYKPPKARTISLPLPTLPNPSQPPSEPEPTPTPENAPASADSQTPPEDTPQAQETVRTDDTPNTDKDDTTTNQDTTQTQDTPTTEEPETFDPPESKATTPQKNTNDEDTTPSPDENGAQTEDTTPSPSAEDIENTSETEEATPENTEPTPEKHTEGSTPSKDSQPPSTSQEQEPQDPPQADAAEPTPHEDTTADQTPEPDAKETSPPKEDTPTPSSDTTREDTDPTPTSEDPIPSPDELLPPPPEDAGDGKTRKIAKSAPPKEDTAPTPDDAPSEDQAPPTSDTEDTTHAEASDDPTTTETEPAPEDTDQEIAPNDTKDGTTSSEATENTTDDDDLPPPSEEPETSGQTRKLSPSKDQTNETKHDNTNTDTPKKDSDPSEPEPSPIGAIAIDAPNEPNEDALGGMGWFSNEPEEFKDPEDTATPYGSSSSKMLYVILGLLLVLGVGGIFFFVSQMPEKTEENANQPTQPAPDNAETQAKLKRIVDDIRQSTNKGALVPPAPQNAYDQLAAFEGILGGLNSSEYTEAKRLFIEASTKAMKDALDGGRNKQAKRLAEYIQKIDVENADAAEALKTLKSSDTPPPSPTNNPTAPSNPTAPPSDTPPAEAPPAEDPPPETPPSDDTPPPTENPTGAADPAPTTQAPEDPLAPPSKPKENIGELYSQASKERGQAALNLYKRIIRADGSQHRAHFQIGQILSQQNQYTEALKYLERAVQINPRNSYYRLYLGNAYLKTGNRDKAIQQYRKVLELDENNKAAKKMIEKLK